MGKISDHFTYKEATFSQNAAKHGIDNIPNADQLDSLKAFGDHVFEPWRRVAGNKPINIVSMFRNGKQYYSTIEKKYTSTNKLAGGHPQSQHMCENGDAAGDFDNDGLPDRVQNNQLFMFAYNNMEVNYDKIIAEDIDDAGHVNWVHISYNRKRKQRRAASVMFFCMENGEQKKIYRMFDITKGLIRKNYLFQGES